MKRKVFVTALICAFVGAVCPNKMWANACDEDVAQACGDIQPGQGALSLCISQHAANFSAQCRELLQKMDNALRRAGPACQSDAREYCRDVRPGYGRIKNCLLSNSDKISQECRDAIQ